MKTPVKANVSRCADRYALMRVKPLALQVAAIWAALYGGLIPPVLAAPTGGHVTAGSAAISSSGATTVINQSSGRSIINWNKFNVANGETVRFNAPSATSATLNRVIGALPSGINGLIQGNGKVFLLNPNGVLVGASGAINVQGGFVGSTGNISDSAFMQGGAMLLAGGKGQIQVLGTISTPGGDIALIAPAVVAGAGSMLKAGTQINLVAADQVTLSNGTITVTPNVGESGTVSVAGTLRAAKVMLAAVNDNLGALAINTSGVIRANGVATNPDGSIQIVAIGGGNVQVSGMLQAQNADGTGGSVDVGGQSVYADNANFDVSGTRGGKATFVADPTSGTVLVGGSYGSNGAYVSGDSSVNASGTAGNGGKINVTGYRTALMGNTLLNASGTAGGGVIRVGGDMQGQGADIANAAGTYVDSSVTLNASGTQSNASGGKVVVWANDTTNYYGNLIDTGSGSGSGGNAEISGHNKLNFEGAVDMKGGSNGGRDGSILWDPSDLTIDAAGAGTSIGFGGAPTIPGSAGPVFTANTSHISWQDIVTALGSGNVTINTNTGGGGAGDIAIAQGYTYNSNNQLLLEAWNNLTVNAGAAITNVGTGTLILASKKIMTIDANLASGGSLYLQAGEGIAVNTQQLTAGPNGRLQLVGNYDPYGTNGIVSIGPSGNNQGYWDYATVQTNYGYGNNQITFNSGTATPVILQGGDVVAVSGTVGPGSNFLPHSVVVEYGPGNTSFNSNLAIWGFNQMEVERWDAPTGTIKPDISMNPAAATAAQGYGITYLAGNALTVPTSLSVPGNESLIFSTVTGNVILLGNSYSAGPTGELVIDAGRGGWGNVDWSGNSYTNVGSVQFASSVPTLLEGGSIFASSGCNTAANCVASDRTTWNPSIVLVHPNAANGQFGYLTVEGFQNIVLQDSVGSTAPLLASNAIVEDSANNITVSQNLIVGSGGQLRLFAGDVNGGAGSGYGSNVGLITFAQPDTILQGDYVYLYAGTGANTAGTIPTNSQAAWLGAVAATEAQLPSQGRGEFDTATNQVQLRPARTDNTFSNLDMRGFDDTRIDLLQNGSNSAVLNTLAVGSNGNLIVQASGNIILPQGYGTTGVTQTMAVTNSANLNAGYDWATGQTDLFGVVKVLAPQPLWQIGGNATLWSGLGYNTTTGSVDRIDFAGGATGSAAPSATDSSSDDTFTGKPIILQPSSSGMFGAVNISGFGNINLYAVNSATTPASLSWSGNVLNGFTQTFPFATSGANPIYLAADHNLNLFNQYFKVGQPNNYDWTAMEAGYNAYSYDMAVKPGKLTFMDPTTLAARTNLAAFQPGGIDEYVLDNNHGGDPGSANDLTNLTWDWSTSGLNYVPMASKFNLYSFRNITVQTVNDLPIEVLYQYNFLNNFVGVQIQPATGTDSPALEGDVNIIPNIYTDTVLDAGYYYPYVIRANSLNTQGVLGMNVQASATVSGVDASGGEPVLISLLHNAVLADGVTPGMTTSLINVSADDSASVNDQAAEEFVNMNVTALKGAVTVNSRGLIDMTDWGNTTDTSNITIRSQGDIVAGANFQRSGVGNLSLQADANLNSIFSGYAAIGPVYTGSNTNPHGYDTAGADGRGAVYGGGATYLKPNFAPVWVVNTTFTVPAGYGSVWSTLDGTPISVGTVLNAGTAVLAVSQNDYGGYFTGLGQTGVGSGVQVFGIYGYSVTTNGSNGAYVSLGTGTPVGGFMAGTVTADAGIVGNYIGQENPMGTIITGNTGSRGLGLSGQFYTAPGGTWAVPLAWVLQASGPVLLTTGTGNIDIRSGYEYQNTNSTHVAGDVADLRLGSSAVADTGLNNPLAVANWFKLATNTGSIAVTGYRDISITDANGINPSAGTAPVSLVANRDLDVLGPLTRATTGSLLTLGAGNMIETAPGVTVNADQLQLIVGNGADIITSANGLSGEIIAPVANPTGVLGVGGTYHGMSLLGDMPTGVMSVTNGKTVTINNGFTNGMVAAFTFGPNGFIWPAPAPYGSSATSPLDPVGLSVQSADATLAGSINVGTTAGDININAPVTVTNSPSITTGEINLKAAGNIAINSNIADSAAAPNGNIFLQAIVGNIVHGGTAQGTDTVSGNDLTMIASGTIGAAGSGAAIDTNVNAALFQAGAGVYVYQSGPLALTAAGTANGAVSITDSQNTLTVGNFPTGTAPQATLIPAVTNNVYVPGLASEIGITTAGSNNITLNAFGSNSDVMAAAHTYTPNGSITINAGRNIVDTQEDTNYGDIGIGTATPASNSLAFSAGSVLSLATGNSIGSDGTTPNPLDVYFGNLSTTSSGMQAESGVYLTALDTSPSSGVQIGGGINSRKNIDVTARASTVAGSGSLNVAGAMATDNDGYVRLAADNNVNVNAAVSANTSGNVVLVAGLSGGGSINQGALGILASGTGEINANAATDINWGANVTTSGNILAQSGQSMSYGGAGVLDAAAVVLTSGTTIGASINAVQTNTNSLAIVNGGNAFVNTVGAVTLAAQSANNAGINVSTTNGPITVGNVTVTSSVLTGTGKDVGWDNNPINTSMAAGASLVGVAANGSGNVNLTANGTGSNVLINQSVGSGSGQITATANSNVVFNNGAAQTGTGVTGIVNLTATNGQLIDNELPGTPVVIGNTLNATAANGIGTAASAGGPGSGGDLATQIGTLNAAIIGTGNAVVQNDGALNVMGSVGANTLNVGSTAGITVSGPIAATGGTVDLTSGMSALGLTGLLNNAGGVTLNANASAGMLSISSSGLVQQIGGTIKDGTLLVDTTRYTGGNSVVLTNDTSTLTESGSAIAGNFTITTGGMLNQTGTTAVGGNLTEAGFTGGTVNGTVKVGGNYSGVDTDGSGGSITAAGANSWTNANSATTGVVVASGAGPDFDLASADLGTGKVVTVDLRSRTATVTGAQDAILLNGSGTNELGTATLTTGGKVMVNTATNDYDLVQTAPVNLASLTVNSVAGSSAAAGLQNNGLGIVNGINYGTHDNALNGGNGSRVSLTSSGNSIGAISINNADTAGVSSDGNITVNNVTLNNGLTVTSAGGAITNGSNIAIQSRTLNLTALGGIGTATSPINYDTATVVTAVGAPGILATAVTGPTGSTFVSTTGPVQLGGMVDTIGYNCTAASSNVCNPATSATGTLVSTSSLGNSSLLGNITLTAAGPMTTGNTVITDGGNITVTNSSGNVTLSNAVMVNGKGSVQLTSAADLLVNAAVNSSTGEVNALGTYNVGLGANVGTGGNVFIQTQNQAITQSVGTVSGDGVVLTAGTTIGTATNRINLNSSRLALRSAGSAYATEQGPTTVAGETTANGALDVQTTEGAMSVGTVNLTPTIPGNAIGEALIGMNADGAGTIRTQANGGDMNVTAAMTSDSGEINAKSTTGNVILGANLTTTGNAFVEGNQAITYTSGTIMANDAVLSSDNGPIGAAGVGTVQTAVSALGVNAASDAFLNNAGAMTLAAKSANTGNLNLSTANGTITVGRVALIPTIAGNAAGLSLSGGSANGTGNANFTAGGAGSDVLITQNITSGGGAINVTANRNVTFNNGVTQSGTGASGIVSVTATNGKVIDNESATTPVVIGSTLNVTAANGIGTAASAGGPGSAGELATEVDTVNTVITGTGNAVMQNNGALNTMGSVGTNTLSVGATRGITVSGPISAAGGTVNLTSGMSALGSPALANNAGGVTVADNVTTGVLSINTSGLLQQTSGAISDTTLRIDTTRYTTGNSATLNNGTSAMNEAGSTVAGNYSIATQGTLNQTGATTVGGSLAEIGETSGIVNGTVTVGGNYSGVNQTSGGGNITTAGSNSAVNSDASVTGVVTANGSGPDFNLSSVNLSGSTLSNITVNLRSISANVTGTTDAVLLNTGNNALGTVTITTAPTPVTVSTGLHDYNLVQTATLSLPATTVLTVNAVAGANTPTPMQDSGIGTIGGINFNAANNVLNGGQGSRIVLNNPANTLGGISINNADAVSVAASGNLQLGAITAANSVVAMSQNGAIVQKASTPAIVASALAFNAATGIGATDAPIRYDSAMAIAAGATPVLATSESGSGNTAVSTTGAVQLGGAINEAGFDLTSSNLSGAPTTGTLLTPTLVYNTAATGEINLLSNGAAILAAHLTTAGNAFIQAASGKIVQTGGTVSANDAVLTALAGSIGTSTNPIATNVNVMGLDAQGDVNVMNAGALTLGAVTASNGAVNVATTNGPLMVSAINAIPTLTGNAIGLTRSGVSADGTGTVNLAAGGSSSNLVIEQNLTSGSGAITATANNNITFSNGVVQTTTGATGLVSLTAANGQIIDNETAATPVVIGNTLNAMAAGGIGTAASGMGGAGDLVTQVSTLGASVTGTGNAVIQNLGALNVSASVGANALDVGATGGITVSGPINAFGGTANLISGMTSLGSTGLSTNAGGVALVSDVTANTLSINASGLVQQAGGMINDNTLMVDTTRFTTGNSAILTNGTAGMTEKGSSVAGNFSISTQGSLDQTGTTTVGGNLAETGQTGGTVNGTVAVGGNYSGVNSYGTGAIVTAGGSNSATNIHAATTGVVVASGSGPDFDLSSVSLNAGQNVTVDLRSTTVSSTGGETNAVLLNAGGNTLGTVTINTAKVPVMLTKTTTDYNLAQTFALDLGNVTVNSVAGASTPTGMQNNTLGTLAGSNYDVHNNALNGGQGSRVVLNNPANSLASITINNADAVSVAASGSLSLGAIIAANSVVANSINGAIAQNVDAPAIIASALQMNAATGIGTMNTPIRYNTATAIGAGVTPVLATSESGAGGTAVSTTGAVQLGGMINEVGFNSANSNLSGTSASGTRLIPIVASNTADTGEINLRSAGAATLAGSITTNGNAFVEATSGDITQTAGKLSAAQAALTADAGNIGTEASPIATNVSTLGLAAQGNVNDANAGALTLGAVTKSNGAVSVTTMNGSLTVGAINLQPTLTGNAIGLTQTGVNANGEGNVVLQANGGDLNVNANTVSGGGEINSKSTSGNINLDASVATTGNAFITAGNSVTRSAGTLTASGAVLTADNGSIGSSTSPLESAVDRLGVNAGIDAYVDNAGAMTAAGSTKGNLSLSTSSGQLTIASLTISPSASGNAEGLSDNGVTTGGNLSLLAAPSTNGVLEIDAPMSVGQSMIGVGGVDVNVNSDVIAAGPITFVADAASGANLGPGWFRNAASVTSNGAGVAVYAVAGGMAPAGYGTTALDQVELGSISGIPNANAPVSRWSQPYWASSFTPGDFSGSGMFYKAKLFTVSPVPQPISPNPIGLPGMPSGGGNATASSDGTLASFPMPPAATEIAQTQYGDDFTIDLSSLFNAPAAWDATSTAMPFVLANYDSSLSINGDYAPPRFMFGIPSSGSTVRRSK
ncbi:filamentous hemagglutinin N-terminal domain-containing protein [Burkholderia sp. JSH-S8]|nr:filamentous hemagglutinin N-terminal domain-containing protein [Burkholderia sp. JSH-S8]